MDQCLSIRLARQDERAMASLMWEEDRDALLAHPDVVDIPASQIAEGHVFVAERGGTVAGFGVVQPRDDGAAVLDGLFVEPGAWSGGIGRQLVVYGEAMAKTAGCTALNVVANKRAAGFYRACGFRSLGEVATAFSPALAMTKPI